jgi:polyphenol oxidase
MTDVEGFVSRAESTEAIKNIDELLGSIGLVHGKRTTRVGTWNRGERVKRVTGSGASGSSSKRQKVDVVRSPAWDCYPWLLHGFSSRAGGVTESYSPGSLNLGWSKDDDPKNVAENRRRFVRAVGGSGAVRLVTLRQTHTGLVRIVEPGDSPLETAEAKAVLRGDGVITDVPGLLLAVQIADCVPVLVADPRNRAVAAFHAGWRGTLKRIVERGIGRMQLRYGSRPQDLIAVIGPSIGVCCYSVGEEVRHEFESQFAYAGELFTEVYDADPVREKYPLLFLTARAPGHSNIGPQIHLNLWEANRRQLVDAGLKSAKITVIGECTACTRVENGTLKYFSHRAESGFTGRMLAGVGVRG